MSKQEAVVRAAITYLKQGTDASKAAYSAAYRAWLPGARPDVCPVAVIELLRGIGVPAGDRRRTINQVWEMVTK